MPANAIAAAAGDGGASMPGSMSRELAANASMARAVSLARSALRGGGAESCSRTYARQGYRFCDDDLLARTGSEAVDGTAADNARLHFKRGEWTLAADAFQAAAAPLMGRCAKLRATLGSAGLMPN